MPRTARASQANYCYHVFNRGNARAEVFHKSADYAAFVELLELACHQRPMRLIGYCLMPNHFHLVVWPSGDGDLGTWMQWLMTSHVRRHHRHYHSSGHVWQGRFKAFPIEEDDHLRVVLRYIERNPLRAKLVERAEDWPWSSLLTSTTAPPTWLDPGSAPRGKGWLVEVNQIAANDDEVIRLRLSLERGMPFGSESWSSRTVTTLGLESSVRPRGRPPKTAGLELTEYP